MEQEDFYSPATDQDDLTVVTFSDFNFASLVPQDITNPLFVDGELQKQVLGAQLIRGRVNPNDEVIDTEDGLKVTSLGGQEYVFKKVEKTIMINGESIQSLHTLGGTVIYVVGFPIHVNVQMVQEAVERQEDCFKL